MVNTDVFEMAALCVRDIMTQTVLRLTPQQSVPEAISLLAQHRFRHLPVVEDAQNVVGIVSDRDLLRALTRGPGTDQMTVQEVMKPQVVTVRPETHCRRLPRLGPLSAAAAVAAPYQLCPGVGRREAAVWDCDFN